MHEIANVRAAALNKVLCQLLAHFLILSSLKIFRYFLKVWIQQSDQGTESILFPAVGSRGYQDQMAFGVISQSRDQVMALLLSAAALSLCAGVSFVNNDTFRTGADKFIPSALTFDVIQRNDHKRIMLKNGFTLSQIPFEPGCGRSQHEFSLDMEFIPEFLLPLFRQRRRAENRDAFDFSAVEQFTGNQSRLNGFPDPDVIGNQYADRILPQSHQQRHKLIRTRFKTQMGE